jgi:hypothetical protein
MFSYFIDHGEEKRLAFLSQTDEKICLVMDVEGGLKLRDKTITSVQILDANKHLIASASYKDNRIMRILIADFIKNGERKILVFISRKKVYMTMSMTGDLQMFEAI